MEKPTLLIPAAMDDHYPLLRWAYESESWHTAVLENDEGITDFGLRYIHNDMCYPCILIAGQILAALRSGAYNPARCGILIAAAGDACRGSCYLGMLRKALDRAGFSQVALVSLNVRGIDREAALPVTLSTACKALAAVIYGDALLLCRNQVLPYEAQAGSTKALWQRWIAVLSADLQAGRGLSPRALRRRCGEIAASFRALPRVERRVQKIAVTGELYTKYCSLGNWGLADYLAGQHCEMGLNGFSWYTLYYMDTHLDEGPLLFRLGGKILTAYVAAVQKGMIAALRQAAFTVLPPFREFKAQAAGLAPFSCSLGDGWLIAAETAAWVKAGYRKVLCTQPFGCLPGHVCGRGLYASLQRKLPGSLIAGVEYDASMRDVTVKSRIQLLLDMESPC